MVDEWQDTNPAQLEILKLLIDHEAEDSSFWTCGDDWQIDLCLYRGIYREHTQLQEDVPEGKGVYPEYQLQEHSPDIESLSEPHQSQHEKGGEDPYDRE